MKLGHPLIAVPLERAALCCSCSAVFLIDEWNACPWCDDEHIVPLTQFVPAIKEARNETTGAATPVSDTKGA